MRLAVAMLFAATTVGLAALLLAGLGREFSRRRWSRAEQSATWEDAHTSRAGCTLVVVRRVARLRTGEQRVLEEQVVARITADDPDWEARFRTARQAAYRRAIELGSPSALP